MFLKEDRRGFRNEIGNIAICFDCRFSLFNESFPSEITQLRPETSIFRFRPHLGKLFENVFQIPQNTLRALKMNCTKFKMERNNVKII